MLKILFVGDVVGKAGRRAAGRLLADLRSRFEAQFVIVNGENVAGGLGITKQTATSLFDAGADVLMLGNHAFAKRDALDYVAQEPRILRPANFPPGVPGVGHGVFAADDGSPVAVVNLIGRTFMDPVDCPFRAADSVLAELAGRAKTVMVEIHAEATSEKVAIGWYLDGRASAVIGTHTHVQTSDERVLPGGTAYITDVGMTGVVDSVLGMDKDAVIQKFKFRVPSKFALAEGQAAVQSVLVEIDSGTGMAASIQRVNVRETD